MPTTEYVTRVIDGDTFTGHPDKTNVRLEGVNAPELHQPNGEKAKGYLQRLIGQKHVTIETKATDRYGRRIAQVWVGQVNVNQAMRDYLKTI